MGGRRGRQPATREAGDLADAVPAGDARGYVGTEPNSGPGLVYFPFRTPRSLQPGDTGRGHTTRVTVKARQRPWEGASERISGPSCKRGYRGKASEACRPCPGANEEHGPRSALSHVHLAGRSPLIQPGPTSQSASAGGDGGGHSEPWASPADPARPRAQCLRRRHAPPGRRQSRGRPVTCSRVRPCRGVPALPPHPAQARVCSRVRT